MPTEQEVQSLADAMWQILDDMGKDGTSACLFAKAQARVAFEPFADWTDWDQEMIDSWMPLDRAKQIVKECDG